MRYFFFPTKKAHTHRSSFWYFRSSSSDFPYKYGGWNYPPFLFSFRRFFRRLLLSLFSLYFHFQNDVCISFFYILGKTTQTLTLKKESHSETMTKSVSFFRCHFTIPSLSLTRNTVFPPFPPVFHIREYVVRWASAGTLGRVGGRGSQRRRWRSYAYMYPPHIRKREKEERPLPPFSAAAGEKIQNSLLPPPFLLRRHRRCRRRPTVRPSNGDPRRRSPFGGNVAACASLFQKHVWNNAKEKWQYLYLESKFTKYFKQSIYFPPLLLSTKENITYFYTLCPEVVP